MKNYFVDGKITFKVSFEQKANNEEEAKKLALEYINDYFRLDTSGTDIVNGSVNVSLDVEDEDDAIFIDDEDGD